MPTLTKLTAQYDDGTSRDLYVAEPPAVERLPAINPLRDVDRPARDYGVSVKGSASTWTVRDRLIRGYSHNISVDTDKDGLIENVVSMEAVRANPADVFGGQGLYVHRSGTIKLRNFAAIRNGRPPGKPINYKSQFKHGVYQNILAGPLDVENCLFAYNASCGVQLRAGGVVRRSLFVGNAINILAIGGEPLIEDCVIFGSLRHANVEQGTGKVLSFTGNCGLMAYTRVRLRNVLFIGWPAQGDANTEVVAVSSYDPGVINVSKGHEYNPTGVGAVESLAVRVKGWPKADYPNKADQTNQYYSGDPGYAGGPTLMPTLTASLADKGRIDALIERVVNNQQSVESVVTEAFNILGA